MQDGIKLTINEMFAHFKGDGENNLGSLSQTD